MHKFPITFEYKDFERKAVALTKKTVSESLMECTTLDGLDLAPSLERSIMSTLVGDPAFYYSFAQSNDSESLCNALSIKYDRPGLLKKIIRSSSVARWIFQVAKNCTGCYCGANNVEFLVVLHHRKFVSFIKDQDWCKNNFDKFGWLCLGDVNGIKGELAKGARIFKPFTYNAIFHENKFIEWHFNNAKSIELSISKLSPKTIVTFEGDAPYHSLIAAIGKKYDVRTICFQWGVFPKTWREIAFSNMKFDYFMCWGTSFATQLKPFNKIKNYILSGYPSRLSNSTNKNKNNIVFLAQGVAVPITQNDFDDFIQLCADISRRFQGRVKLRPHPNFPLTIGETKRLSVSSVIILDSKLSLIEQLEDCRIVVGINTSSFIEGMLCGAVPVSFNRTCTSVFDLSLDEIGIGVETDSYEHAIDAICNYMESNKALDTSRRMIKKILPDLIHEPTNDDLLDIGKIILNNSH